MRQWLAGRYPSPLRGVQCARGDSCARGDRRLRHRQAPWSSPSRRPPPGVSTRCATCRRRTSGAWGWIWRRWRCRGSPSHHSSFTDAHHLIITVSAKALEFFFSCEELGIAGR